MSPDVIVDTGVVARGVAASETKSQSGWLSTVRPPCILLADGIILVDTIQTYHQVEVPVIIMDVSQSSAARLAPQTPSQRIGVRRQTSPFAYPSIPSEPPGAPRDES